MSARGQAKVSVPPPAVEQAAAPADGRWAAVLAPVDGRWAAVLVGGRQVAVLAQTVI
jgi:hypothetical protein